MIVFALFALAFFISLKKVIYYFYLFVVFHPDHLYINILGVAKDQFLCFRDVNLTDADWRHA